MTRSRPGAAGGRSHLVPLHRGWSLWRRAALRGAGFPMRTLDALAVPETAAKSCEPSGAIDALLLDDGFRTALTWQSPDLMRNWAARYAAALRNGERPRLSRRDRREALIARYAQRYCAKNDTVGFFGAVGWARFVDHGPDLTTTGTGGVRRRGVHFEPWTGEALAEAWRRDRLLLPWLPVRLDPSSVFDGRSLRRAGRRPQPVDALAAALLRAVDGRRRVGEVAAAAAGPETRTTEGDAVEALTDLHDKGIVQIGFLVPCDARPEDHLRRQADALPAEHGARVHAVLDRLEKDRRDVLNAGPDGLLAALDQVDRTLAEAGASRPDRRGGTGAGRGTPRYGRTALYLDCRRDLDADLGPGVLDRLAVPLAALLDGARWLAAEVADMTHRELVACCTRLRRGTGEVTLGQLQLAAADVLSGADDRVDEIVEDFQLRWGEILPHRGTGEIKISGAVATRLAETLFPPRTPGWAAARYHSPDLMLARGVDGRLRWVLGELHVALNTLESRVFLTQADDREELIGATEADMRQGRVVPVHPSTSPYVTARTFPPSSLDPPGRYRYWSYGRDQGHPSGALSAPAAGLRVFERDGVLFARHDAGAWEAPVLELFGDFLTALVVNRFRLRPARPHAPRVAIDDLVVCRETWRFAAGAVPVPATRAADREHRALRRWAREQGLPRRVFVRSADEPKPFYVDFAAPLLIENFARCVRRSATPPGRTGAGGHGLNIEVVEMLPGPEELWLGDDAGRRYTSEFRIVAVDPRETGPAFHDLPTGRADSAERA